MISRYRVVIPDPVPEKTTQKLRLGTLKDENGQVIPAGSLASLSCWLYNQSDQVAINPAGRPFGQSIFNANGGAADGTEAWSLVFGPLDTAILDQKTSEEAHVLLVGWTYGTAGVGYFEIVHTVRNLAYVT